MAAPERFKKIAHRYDQFTKAEVTIWHSRAGGEFGDEVEFVIEVNGKQSPVYSLGEIQSLQDCLKNDLDLSKPAGFGRF